MPGPASPEEPTNSTPDGNSESNEPSLEYLETAELMLARLGGLVISTCIGAAQQGVSELNGWKVKQLPNRYLHLITRETRFMTDAITYRERSVSQGLNYDLVACRSVTYMEEGLYGISHVELRKDKRLYAHECLVTESEVDRAIFDLEPVLDDPDTLAALRARVEFLATPPVIN